MPAKKGRKTSAKKSNIKKSATRKRTNAKKSTSKKTIAKKPAETVEDAFSADTETLADASYQNLKAELESAWSAGMENGKAVYEFYSAVEDLIDEAYYQNEPAVFLDFANKIKERNLTVSAQEMYDAKANEAWLRDARAALSEAQSKNYTNEELERAGYNEYSFVDVPEAHIADFEF